MARAGLARRRRRAGPPNEEEAVLQLTPEQRLAASGAGYADLIFNPTHWKPWRGRLREMIEQQPVATICADQRGLQQRADRHGELQTFQLPTLVVVGDQDIITPPTEAEQMAHAIPGAQLRVIRGTGHMSPMEDAAQWSAAVATFWNN